jgi:hypothetical protein
MSEKFGSIPPEEEMRRQVLRLEIMAKNLVILLEEGKSDLDNFDESVHVRRIVEYIQWWDNIYPKANDDQKVALKISRDTLSASDPYYISALDIANGKNI